MPVEPPSTRWVFADPAATDASTPPEEHEDLVAIGADLEPGTLLEAYRRGIFPMPVGDAGDPMYWFSPARRGVLRPERLRVSRSLRRSVRDFEIRVDTCFEDVVRACGDPAREHGWIDEAIVGAYVRLHRLGWAHSVECWRDGRLEGGLYGLAIGGLFAGESMFHRARDASKVALVALVDLLGEPAGSCPPSERWRGRLVDVQWSTPHLASLGVEEISRADYLASLAEVLATPLPAAFASKLDDVSQ